MKKIIVDIVIEPKGQIYSDLLDYAVPFCDTALLVIRHGKDLDPLAQLEPLAQQLLKNMAPFLKKQEELSGWPGTELLGHTAMVFQYAYGPECAKILKGAADGLYSWQQPALPEDLCLLRSDGEPWLVTIAHEQDSYLSLPRDELQRLLDTLPALRSVVKEHVDNQSSALT